MRLAPYPVSPNAAAPALLILLPGLNMRLEDFVAHGFVAALAASAAPPDLLLAEPQLDSYFDGTITTELLSLIRGERARHAQIWLGGISLGCLGALLAAAAQPEAVAGAILLAPYLGAPGLIAEVERAGGLAAWEPGIIATNDGERRVLAWLRAHSASLQSPRLYLGYGTGDRFAASSALLAACLPQERVWRSEGGHDWPTWSELWRRILAARPFARAAF